MTSDSRAYVSRAGQKLEHSLAAFKIDPTGFVCADLGCSTGGFTDCLLQHGAAKVYAVDRGYGVLDYRLRSDPRVVVLERTDALNLHLPEWVGIVTIDCGWTRQALILPVARRLLAERGQIISLIKPHYEADPNWLENGVLLAGRLDGVLTPLRAALSGLGLQLVQETESPILGRGGNREFLWQLETI